MKIKDVYWLICLFVLIISTGFVEHSPLLAMLGAVIGCGVALFVGYKRASS